MRMIFSLARDYKPLTVFGTIGVLLVVTGSIPGIIVILGFLRTGLIARLPSAVLAVGLVLSGVDYRHGRPGLAYCGTTLQELDLQIRFLGRELSDDQRAKER